MQARAERVEPVSSLDFTCQEPFRDKARQAGADGALGNFLERLHQIRDGLRTFQQFREEFSVDWLGGVQVQDGCRAVGVHVLLEIFRVFSGFGKRFPIVADHGKASLRGMDGKHGESQSVAGGEVDGDLVVLVPVEGHQDGLAPPKHVPVVHVGDVDWNAILSKVFNDAVLGLDDRGMFPAQKTDFVGLGGLREGQDHRRSEADSREENPLVHEGPIGGAHMNVVPTHRRNYDILAQHAGPCPVGGEMHMGYTPEQLRQIYDRSEGCCTYCDKRLSIQNYGRHGERGAWHVDHRRSRANGGTDHGNNLAAACISCNLVKGARNAKSYQRSIEVEEEGSGAGWLLFGLGAAALALLFRRSPPGGQP